MVESLSSCFGASPSRICSAVEGPAFQMKSTRACWRSVSCLLRIVTLLNVALGGTDVNFQQEHEGKSRCSHAGERLPTMTVGTFEDSFVIHFGTELPRVNAYTLPTTPVNRADAANAAIYPGYDIEVVVAALGSGSFRTTVRAVHQYAPTRTSSV